MAMVRDSKQSVTITLRPKTQCTHIVAKCALPVCCVISEHCTWAINGHAIQKYCIHWLQAGYIRGSPNVAYTAGHMTRAAGGESNLYFTMTLWLFRVMEGGGKEIKWIEWKLILALLFQFFLSLTHQLSSHLPFDVHFEIPFLKNTVI